MTREEAIKWFEGEKEAAERQVVAFESCFKCFKSAHRKIVAYNDMAIAALREQEKVAQVEKALTNKMRELESKLRALESNRVESHTVNECEWCAKWKSATCPLESPKEEVCSKD